VEIEERGGKYERSAWIIVSDVGEMRKMVQRKMSRKSVEMYQGNTRKKPKEMINDGKKREEKKKRCR